MKMKVQGQEQDEYCRKPCSGMFTMIKIALPALVEKMCIACFNLQMWKII